MTEAVPTVAVLTEVVPTEAVLTEVVLTEVVPTVAVLTEVAMATKVDPTGEDMTKVAEADLKAATAEAEDIKSNDLIRKRCLSVP